MSISTFFALEKTCIAKMICFFLLSILLWWLWAFFSWISRLTVYKKKTPVRKGGMKTQTFFLPTNNLEIVEIFVELD